MYLLAGENEYQGMAREYPGAEPIVVWGGVGDEGKSLTEGDFFTTLFTNSPKSRMSIFFWDERIKDR